MTGAQVGLPAGQVPRVARSGSGTRWSSAQGQIQIETFRIRGPGTTLEMVAESQRSEPPNRKLEVNFTRDDFFVLSGLQGLKKFYVRAQIRDLEVRGVTILYDQATEGIMDPVTVVMSSAFAPFSGTGLADVMGPARRKVEYGTGIVITPGGHVLTDRLLIESCNVIQVAGLGDATVLAEDDKSGLALLRVFGVSDLTPAALMHDGVRGRSLVGIADPAATEAAAARSTTTGRLLAARPAGSPQPVSGRRAFIAGPSIRHVTLRPADGRHQRAHRPAWCRSYHPKCVANALRDTRPGRAGVEAAKASVARVMCVRR